MPPQYHHRGSCTSLDANRASSHKQSLFLFKIGLLNGPGLLKNFSLTRCLGPGVPPWPWGVFLCAVIRPKKEIRNQIHLRRWKINGFNTKNTEAAQNVCAASWHQRARFQTTMAECCSGVTPAPEEVGVLLPGCPGGPNSVAETTSTDILPPCAPS